MHPTRLFASDAAPIEARASYRSAPCRARDSAMGHAVVDGRATRLWPAVRVLASPLGGQLMLGARETVCNGMLDG